VHPQRGGAAHPGGLDGTPVTATALCEVGPLTVRSLCWSTGESAVDADPELAEAALAFDDPFALVGRQVIAVDELWRRVLRPLLVDVDDCLLVHPSWWPITRVKAVRELAAALASNVDAISRARLAAARYPDSVQVEIAPHAVIVIARGTNVIGIQPRSEAPDVLADAVVRLARQFDGARSISIDAPVEVPGAPILAGSIIRRLRGAGARVHSIDRHQIALAAEELKPQPMVRAQPERRQLRVMAAAAVLIAAAGAMLWWERSEARIPDVATTALVEGRVTAQIPADWIVRHATGGPGSARVEVVSPGDPAAVLHLTQARILSDDLSATAEALRTALEAEPPGVFVDFNPADLRAGRPAVTYREMRAGHDIRWTVVVDGGVRIGIGCQSGPARDSEIDAACDRVVHTVRQIG
jgi:type VII secretion-associated protein (TIGR03931 family)